MITHTWPPRISCWKCAWPGTSSCCTKDPFHAISLLVSTGKWIPPWQSSAGTKKISFRFSVSSEQNTRSCSGAVKNFNMERLSQKGDLSLHMHTERETYLCSGKNHIHRSFTVFLPTLPTSHTAIINSSAQVLGARTLLLFVQPVMSMYFCIPVQGKILPFGIKDKREHSFPTPSHTLAPSLNSLSVSLVLYHPLVH